MGKPDDLLSRLEMQLIVLRDRINYERSEMAKVLADQMGYRASVEDHVERQNVISQHAAILHELEKQLHSVESSIKKLKDKS